MLPLRWSSSEVKPAHNALAQGRYALAFALLEGAAQRQPQRRKQAELKLHLAAVYALHKLEGTAPGLLCLQQARDLDAGILSLPLYQSLQLYFNAQQQNSSLATSLEYISQAQRIAQANDAISSFYAAAALLQMQAQQQAQTLLQAIDSEALPDYLYWRRHALLGQCYEAAGHYHEAANAYSHAAAHSHGEERDTEQLKRVRCLLYVNEAYKSWEILRSFDSCRWQNSALHALQALLEGQCHMQLGNPSHALWPLLRAQSQQEKLETTDFWRLHHQLARCYSLLGDTTRAEQHYCQARGHAPAEQQSLLWREQAALVAEYGRWLEAQQHSTAALEALPSHEELLRGQLLSQLAEYERLLGYLDDAQEHALLALDYEADASACLCLGRIALARFAYDEALMHFEQSLTASQNNDPEQLRARLMLCETLAQQGLQNPERLLYHAHIALSMLPPDDIWLSILQSYIRQAQEKQCQQQPLYN